MSQTLTALKHDILQWAESAHRNHLLSSEDFKQLQSLGVQTPAMLFDGEERPLVVGFFGGTGVGKSSLLNRMADAPIARTGVERPTSKEITLYLHEAFTLAQLPEEFPTEHMRCENHRRAEHRHILWIDMPDFDSVESSNRDKVKAWLPHIDTLIYVVSPERYKDDNGWRLLLSQGHQHAWLFVINHWDRGSAEQREDFIQTLQQAGFDAPHVFCTDCGTDPVADEFDDLQQTVQRLADGKIVMQLEARGVSLRSEEMRKALDAAVTRMGNQSSYQSLRSDWNELFEQTTTRIIDHARWKFSELAKPYAVRDRGLWSSLLSVLNRSTGGEVAEPLQPDIKIFDPETIAQLQSCLSETVQRAQQQGIPALSVRAYTQDTISSQVPLLDETVKKHLTVALETPGSPAQRKLHRLANVLTTLLPLAATSWAGYRIINAFNAGADNPDAYLTGNFAINAILLIAIAALIPALLAYKTRPSFEKTARRGYLEGTRQALLNIHEKIDAALQDLAHSSARQAKAAAALFETLEREGEQKQVSDKAVDSEQRDIDQLLSRVLTK